MEKGNKNNERKKMDTKQKNIIRDHPAEPQVDFAQHAMLHQMDQRYFLFGLLNAFMNRLQAEGDLFFEEVSWKQCFVFICVGMFEEPPAIKEVARLIGSSHQNVKQLLLKLQKAGLVKLYMDERDRRKQRIQITEIGHAFNRKYEESSKEYMNQLFFGIGKEQIEGAVTTILAMEQNLMNFEKKTEKKRQ